MNRRTDVTPYVRSMLILHALRLSHRTLIHNVTRVQRGGRLKQHNPAFFIGYGTMLHATRNDNELTFLEPLVAVAKLHAEPSLHDQKHLVFILVMMKEKLALGLHQFHLLSVKLARDVRFVIFR